MLVRSFPVRHLTTSVVEWLTVNQSVFVQPALLLPVQYVPLMMYKTQVSALRRDRRVSLQLQLVLPGGHHVVS